MMYKSVRTRVIAAAVLSITSLTLADEEQAKAYLNAAREDIKNGNFDSVERSLELMEEQFEGVPAAVQAQLKSAAAKVKQEAADKKFTAAFDDAEKKLTALEKDRDLKRQLAAAQANPKDENAMAFLGGAIQNCKNFESESLKPLPPEHPRTKAITARYEKFAAPIAKLAMAGERQTLLDRLKERWTTRKQEIEQQTKPDGRTPSFDEWAKGDGGLPVERSLTSAVAANTLLEDDQFKPFISAFADDAEVSALAKEMRIALDSGAARVIGDVNKIVEAAETAPPNNNDVPQKLSTMNSQIESNLKGIKGQPELSVRIVTLLKKWENGETAAREAHAKQIDANMATAKEVWPAILAQYEGKTVDIDPAAALADIGQYKGKLIRFQDKANVGGTQYGGPDFSYVATVDGKPVAFKLSSKGIAVAAKYLKWNDNHPIGSGEYSDVIGRVTGTGKLNVLSKNTITDQYEVIGQIDAPVAEIVAFQSQFVSFDEDKGSNIDVLK